MLLQKESDQNPIKITAYSKGKIKISGTEYLCPILLSNTEIAHYQPASHFTEFKFEHFKPYLVEKTEIIILGCGDTQQFLSNEQTQSINDLGIAVEIMCTRQACHTYQVLNHEKRHIMALLFAH